MNKIFIVLGVISIHLGFQPHDITHQYNEMTEVVISEYQSACIRKTIHLSGEGYNCRDLKRYLKKKGYNAPK